jgi:hypothetical protein
MSRLPALACLWSLLLGPAAFASEQQTVDSPAPTHLAQDAPIHQLRVYELFDDTRSAFHDRFRDHAARIMDRHGFDIVAIWESRSEQGRPQFVYLLQWPDEATMRTRWDAFMADEEWSAIKRRTGAEHGDFVGGIEEKTLRVVDYSPHTVFEEG